MNQNLKFNKQLVRSTNKNKQELVNEYKEKLSKLPKEEQDNVSELVHHLIHALIRHDIRSNNDMNTH